MQIFVGDNRIRIHAPAKVNLFLEVLGKRTDGFHEIETLMCPIQLFDIIDVEATEAPEIQLHVSCPAQANDEPNSAGPAWRMPAREDNLVYRAASRVRSALGTSQGCRIALQKRIPAAAGLGGGSSDAAATVVACSHLWSGWNRELAQRICSDLGSDLPFFLGNSTQIGLSLATGRGEICSTLPYRPALRFCVTHPNMGCSTAEIYKNYRSSGEKRPSSEIIQACKFGQFQKIGASLFNALQLPAYRLNEWVSNQLKLFAAYGFEFSMMTGSGSACFALLDDSDRPGTTGLKMQQQFQDFEREAIKLGIERTYVVKAWFATSIEEQLLRNPVWPP